MELEGEQYLPGRYEMLDEVLHLFVDERFINSKPIIDKFLQITFQFPPDGIPTLLPSLTYYNSSRFIQGSKILTKILTTFYASPPTPQIPPKIVSLTFSFLADFINLAMIASIIVLSVILPTSSSPSLVTSLFSIPSFILLWFAPSSFIPFSLYLEFLQFLLPFFPETKSNWNYKPAGKENENVQDGSAPDCWIVIQK